MMDSNVLIVYGAIPNETTYITVVRKFVTYLVGMNYPILNLTKSVSGKFKINGKAN